MSFSFKDRVSLKTCVLFQVFDEAPSIPKKAHRKHRCANPKWVRLSCREPLAAEERAKDGKIAESFKIGLSPSLDPKQ